MYREKIITELIKDKDVLDIGSLGQSNEYCLWKLIADHCKTLIGVDLPESFQTIKNESLSHKEDSRIVYGNMETINLKKKFDIVVAGDILEHVSNQGLLLDNIHRHLRDSGKLILTTPNAKWPTIFLKPNITHTLWHDCYTLTTLMHRHKFNISSLQYYYGNKMYYSWWKKMLLARQSILLIAKTR